MSGAAISGTNMQQVKGQQNQSKSERKLRDLQLNHCAGLTLLKRIPAEERQPANRDIRQSCTEPFRHCTRRVYKWGGGSHAEKSFETRGGRRHRVLDASGHLPDGHSAMMPAKRRIVLIGVMGVIALLGIFVVVAFVILAKRQQELEHVINDSFMITMSLRVYVSDNSSFPKSLQAMVESGDMDARLLKPPYGASINYFCPSPSARDETEVLVLTYGTNRVVVTKDFSRTLNP
jgi:hypothetical protein